mmetsp:Transcript_6147/g.20489  ORF Transcript_6147/g.20489 Transcript_6147/m.20489 type:complete len:261 (+) Transcript_6147:399-1181(+)
MAHPPRAGAARRARPHRRKGAAVATDQLRRAGRAAREARLPRRVVAAADRCAGDGDAGERRAAKGGARGAGQGARRRREAARGRDRGAGRLRPEQAGRERGERAAQGAARQLHVHDVAGRPHHRVRRRPGLPHGAVLQGRRRRGAQLGAAAVRRGGRRRGRRRQRRTRVEAKGRRSTKGSLSVGRGERGGVAGARLRPALAAGEGGGMEQASESAPAKADPAWHVAPPSHPGGRQGRQGRRQGGQGGRHRRRGACLQGDD